MVLTRPIHRRGVPSAITFGNGGCALPCCDPDARQEVSTIKTPLPHACRIAFLMACTRSVPRLAEECVRPLHMLPTEVVQRIFEFCVRCVRTALMRAKPALTHPRLTPAPLPSFCAVWNVA